MCMFSHTLWYKSYISTYILILTIQNNIFMLTNNTFFNNTFVYLYIYNILYK